MVEINLKKTLMKNYVILTYKYMFLFYHNKITTHKSIEKGDKPS